MTKDRAQELREGLFKKGVLVTRGKHRDPANEGLGDDEIAALDAENVGAYGMKLVGGKWTRPGKK